MKTYTIEDVPSFDDLFIPVLKAIEALGGSGNIEEINEKVYEILNLDSKILEVTHNSDGRTEIEYRLAWARTYLKKYGLIDNSVRGVWTLLSSALDYDKLDKSVITKEVRANSSTEPIKTANSKSKKNKNISSNSFATEGENWKDELLGRITKISPSGFERLAQRILRESGFIQVEVTGRSNDGGIDGKGIVRINGFISFHVIFQCKRYKGSVSPSQIRDFRGAMQGRADKGIFITTGNFTRDAMKEATRDGAPPIDLIDGELLCEKLKELKLGIEIEMVENIKINTDWFASFDK
jgi:restriction system protein